MILFLILCCTNIKKKPLVKSEAKLSSPLLLLEECISVNKDSFSHLKKKLSSNECKEKVESLNILYKLAYEQKILKSDLKEILFKNPFLVNILYKTIFFGDYDKSIKIEFSKKALYFLNSKQNIFQYKEVLENIFAFMAEITLVENYESFVEEIQNIFNIKFTETILEFIMGNTKISKVLEDNITF